ncbi:AzlC family ABC transporter permease [Noviherbaspirillum aerium]|uniref:AzlC family ABC transporter permease n=1 Tax=Noviherbaspirillum aerium TaxID=2588497 RepID=UPI00178C6D8D|nr:AzlC family ABC transporter permease [Noviherbaspirillum aerium]
MLPEAGSRNLMTQAAAVALGLFPIGVLFGVIAQQSQWSWSDVLLLSMFGFSASGQFFYLKLANEQASLLSMFFVILMLNIRYVPMSLAAWNAADNGSRMLRLVLSHFISDESFAIEPRYGRLALRATVRAIIYASWVLSTVCGVIAGQLIPSAWIDSVSQYLLFPATAILAILAVKRIDSALAGNHQFGLAAKLLLIAGCIAFSIAAMYFFGKEAFWIPGIAGVCLILYLCRWGEEKRDERMGEAR